MLKFYCGCMNILVGLYGIRYICELSKEVIYCLL